MKSLLEFIKEAEENRIAIGHFNIAGLEQLKAIFEAGQELSLSQKANIPLIIGTSEGEAEFIGFKQAAALVKSLREEFNYPIFINADHMHSMENAKEAVLAGYDAVIFDAGKLPLEENIKQTKEAVYALKSINPKILVEGEIGFIGASSKILKEIPKEAAIKPEDLTKPEEAEKFVRETQIDLFSPAVGSIHGMLADMTDPHLDIERIGKIRRVSGVPMVLHGGSGLRNEDFLAAIDAGISVIHINTEIRVAWRDALRKSLAENNEEIAPYKVMAPVVSEMEKAVIEKLKVFGKLF